MTTIRLTCISILICGIIYPALILGIAQLGNPASANGSLIKNTEGKIIGSQLIAQSFENDRYFHPRPSACDYNAQASAASNISPRDARLQLHAKEIIEREHATQAHPIPADMVSSSGSGLDPHITATAARFQASRIAQARGVDEQRIMQLIEDHKHALMGEWGGPDLINVLELNLAMESKLK